MLRSSLFQFNTSRINDVPRNKCWKALEVLAKAPLCTAKRFCCAVSTHKLVGEERQNDESKEITCVYRTGDFPDLAHDRKSKERLRLLLRQHTLRLKHGLRAPQELSPQDVLDLLALSSFRKRCRLFEYLFYKEQKRLRQHRQEVNCLASVTEDIPSFKREFLPHTADRIEDYGLFRNSFLIRIRGSTINRYYESRQIPAILFGQSVVFDLGYDGVMSLRECNKAARDLLEAYGWNRCSGDPFHLHFCNASPNGATARILQDELFAASEHTVLSEITPSSYLDMFPKEKLVYLTPDSENTLDAFDCDAVYVIGALVDKETKEGATRAKATSEGLKTARFPQTFTWHWEKEISKPLHMTDVFKVLLALKRTNSWKYALKYLNSKVTVLQESSSICVPTTPQCQTQGIA
ncbi:tRNA methyltransferase 10 homolog C-like [Dermacentor albipictus]|uniref:tRNA methyltransferase 10 homolog C-like n=1 Tax=Dermacentor albipictus TaxID=60249 RepID=UPI0031FC2A03